MLLPAIRKSSTLALTKLSPQSMRSLSGAVTHAKQLPPRPTIKESDIEESFLKGSGPGGQKINKTSSAVQLKHFPTGIVVKSQATRSRTQNRSIARRLLAEKLECMDKGSESRVALKIDIKAKKKANKRKKAKRKYGKPDEDGDSGQETEMTNDSGTDDGPENTRIT